MEHDLEALFERFARRADVDALEQVFDRAAPELLKIALHLAHDAAQAEDLVQATFVRAIEHAARHDGERAVLPWLIGILAHEAAHARRDGQRSLDPERVTERASVDPAEASAAREVSNQLAAAVRGLPSPYRDVLEPHLLDGLRAVDVARKLERAPGTVRMQILRGLELLRKALPPSLATAALLANGTRGHAALRELVRARGAEFARTLAPSSAPASPSIARTLGGPSMSVKLALTLAVPALALAAWFARPEPRAALAPAAGGAPALVPEPRGSAEPRLEGKTRQDPAPAARAPVPAARAPSARGGAAGANSASHHAVSATELAGRVLDLGGQPVSGAHVTLSYGERRFFDLLDPASAGQVELVGEATSDGAGEFHFAVERGAPFDLRAELGTSLLADAANHYAGQYVELALGTGHVVYGHVTRASDGEPVEGALVRVFPLGASAPTLEREALSLADGSYAVRVFFGDQATLAVTHTTEGTIGWRKLAFAGDGNALENVALAPGITVAGRVTDAESGAPVEGATVGDNWTFERTVTSDANGAYQFPNCPLLGLRLYVHANGYGRYESSSPPQLSGTGAQLDIQLHAGHVAIGRIVDASAEPVAGAYVVAVAYGTEGISTHTDADGRFRLEPLAPERAHALLVTRRGYATQVYDFPASEATQATTDLGQITLKGAQLLGGRVVDGAGAIVPNVAVTLTGWNSDRFVLAGGDASNPRGGSYVAERMATADADGRFWFGGLATGTYHLVARQTGRRESAPMSVLVQEGDERDDIELAFPAGLSIRGFLRDVQGQPLPGASVDATADDGSDQGFLPGADAAADGSFVIEGLAEGTYQLEGSMLFVRDALPDEPWIPTFVEHVAAGGEPVTLVIERGATIEGVVRDAQGAPAVGLFVQPRVETFTERISGGTTDLTGHFRVVVPKNTRWTIDAFGNGKFVSEPNLLAGTHDLVLQLGP